MSTDQELRITFQPSGRTVYALPGTTILEAAARAGIVLLSPCGGGGTCGKCMVRVCSGATGTRPAHSHRLTAAQVKEGWCLACSTTVEGAALIEVPASSMFERSQKILTGDAGHTLAVDPAVSVTTVQLPPPTQQDDCPDLERLGAALREPLEMDAARMVGLPRRLRAASWHVHVVREGRRLIDVQPAAAPATVLGVAFDLGTTTVVGTLLDLVTGQERALASTMNGQIPFGDDVLSRILRIRENLARLPDLQAAAMHSLNEIVSDLCRQAGVAPEAIVSATLAGNTTMQQIVCGIDPSALGELPFTPVFARSLEVAAYGIGLKIHPAARLHVFPQVGGFVGGDTVAGMLASGFDRLKKPTLLVDIGTNGEIALLRDSEILCASTAAGPAFEGARIAQGMRATAGAIEKVLVKDGDLHINIIGNVPAAGLCGTALIDTVAEMLRHGLLDTTGRILEPDELATTVPEALRRRIEHADHDSRFVLTPANGAQAAVCLTQRDIRELQLASGAIRAGVETLLQRAGLTALDLDAVLLAGAFGNFIRRSNAQRIGLLPPLPHERIRFIGNASSMGAKMALLSVKERARAEALRKRSVHVDLSADPNFQEAFGMAMMFPEEVPGQ
ncbi:MAG: ASKHA domain-containing protein [bacterium]